MTSVATNGKRACIGCKKEYKLVTLAKYGGSHCKRCYDKLEGQKACIQCNKLFTIVTLNKNDKYNMKIKILFI